MLGRWIAGVVLTVIGLGLQQPLRRPLGDATPAVAPLSVREPWQVGGRDEYPVVDVPLAYRVNNWAPYGSGSCVHASMVMLFNWQGRPDLGRFWHEEFHSGETPQGLTRKMEGVGVRWAGVTNGDVAFLEWCCRTRRGCGVTVQGGAHMVCLVHLDELRAGILDNNSPGRIRWTSRDDFLTEWQASRLRWAVTPVYDPPPRLPFVSEVLL